MIEGTEVITGVIEETEDTHIIAIIEDEEGVEVATIIIEEEEEDTIVIAMIGKCRDIYLIYTISYSHMF